MADETFRNILPPTKAVDNLDGTFSVGVSVISGLGSLGATCWVVANDAKAEVKAFAQKLQASGYPAWVCDGVNDQAQIQAAIDALPAGGGQVLLLEGTYVFAAIVTPTSNVTISGQGMSTKIEAPAGGDYAFATMFLISGVNDVHITDMSFDCLKRVSYAVQILNSARIYIENIDVDDTWDDGMSIEGGSTYVTVSNSVFHDCQNPAITPGTAAGIEIEDGATDVLITGCNSYNNQAGVSIQTHNLEDGCQRISIVDCWLHDNTYDVPAGPMATQLRITETTPATAMYDIRISGCILTGGKYGIALNSDRGSGFIICENVISDSSVYAIDATGDSTGLRICNNNIKDAIDIHITMPDVVVESNYLMNTGILYGGADCNRVSIISNVLRQDSGIKYILAQAATRTRILDNNLYDCAIWVISGDSPTITGNYVYGGYVDAGHGYSSIYVDSCDFTTVALNTVEYPDTTGIRVDTSDYVLIEGNQVLQTQSNNGAGRGIRAHNCNYVSILGNIVSNTVDANQQYGIVGSGTNTEVISGNVISGSSVSALSGVNADTYSNQRSDLFMDVLAASANYIVDAQNLVNGAVALTGTQPKYPRGLDCTITNVAGAVSAYTMTVVGVNAKGKTITEVFTFADDGLVFSSDNAFDNITSVTLADVADTGNATFVMGIDTRLGLMNDIQETTDVWKIIKNGTKETVAGAQVDVAKDIYDMSVITLAATDDFEIWYRSNLNIIS